MTDIIVNRDLAHLIPTKQLSHEHINNIKLIHNTAMVPFEFYFFRVAT